MNNEKSVLMTEEECYMVERYWFEFIGLKELITQFLTSEHTVHNDKFKAVIDEYLESHSKYNIVFNMVIDKYEIDRNKHNPKVDFAKRSIIY